MRPNRLSAYPILVALLFSGTAAADPAAALRPDEVRTGRSVAVTAAPAHDYWLSRDLNRLFLQSPAPAAERSATPSH